MPQTIDITDVNSEVITIRNEASELAELIYRVCEGEYKPKDKEAEMIQFIDNIKGAIDTIESHTKEIEKEIDQLKDQINELEDGEVIEDEDVPGSGTINGMLGIINYNTQNLANRQLMEAFGKLVENIPPYQLIEKLEAIM